MALLVSTSIAAAGVVAVTRRPCDAVAADWLDERLQLPQTLGTACRVADTPQALYLAAAADRAVLGVHAAGLVPISPCKQRLAAGGALLAMALGLAIVPHTQQWAKTLDAASPDRIANTNGVLRHDAGAGPLRAVHHDTEGQHSQWSTATASTSSADDAGPSEGTSGQQPGSGGAAADAPPADLRLAVLGPAPNEQPTGIRRAASTGDGTAAEGGDVSPSGRAAAVTNNASGASTAAPRLEGQDAHGRLPPRYDDLISAYFAPESSH